MKKITMIFVTVLMVAGLASSAIANPGWSKGQRYDNRGQYSRTHDRYDHRDYRNYRGHYQQPVHYVPVRAYEPVVRVYQPSAPSFSLFFPNLSIQIR